MSFHPSGTFCYRLLVALDQGETLGNTVYVGLDVSDQDARAPLVFSGLARRIETIREALEDVRTFDGHLFATTGTTDARHLESVMVSRHMQCFRPTLVRGEEILEKLRAERAHDR
ncbi:MAG: hypothetical protein AB7T06_41160 [Kofleriaceae bacterium]